MEPDLNKHVEIESCSKMYLLELGFVPGTKITIATYVFGMIVVFIRGTKIALRKEDFDCLKFVDCEI